MILLIFLYFSAVHLLQLFRGQEPNRIVIEMLCNVTGKCSVSFHSNESWNDLNLFCSLHGKSIRKNLTSQWDSLIPS